MKASDSAPWSRGWTALARAWQEAWFVPVDPRPLAAVRILAALLGLLLLWSYAEDLLVWFGPDGSLPGAVTAAWRPRFGWSLYDLCHTATAVRVAFGCTLVVFALLLVGAATTVTAPLAAVAWASLMHRGPMLAGPADDGLSVLLWCLAIGPAGAAWSLDRCLGRGPRAAPSTSVRAAIALRMLLVHAVVMAAAAVVSQAKADVWWDGTAAWWLGARTESRLVDPSGLFARSEWLLDLVTHAVTLFEILFAIGLCVPATRAVAARVGLVAWPLVGILAAEPWWGAALAIACIPAAELLPGDGCDAGRSLR